MEVNIAVGGGHIWAEDTGGAKDPQDPSTVLVLLHPGWGDSTIWLPFLRVLPAGYRVIRYDTRGYGRSPAPATPFSQVEDLVTVLDDRGADRVLLVGHSGGGGTSLGLAVADPGRVRALLLLAPGIPGYPWPLDDPYFAEAKPLLAARDRDGLVALSLRTWAAASPDQAAQAQIRAGADALFRQGGHERPDPPAYDRLGEIRVPAVVVTGDLEYPMVARCAADIAARIPGCRQVAAPGADHLLPLRAPDLIAGLVSELESR